MRTNSLAQKITSPMRKSKLSGTWLMKFEGEEENIRDTQSYEDMNQQVLPSLQSYLKIYTQVRDDSI